MAVMPTLVAKDINLIPNVRTPIPRALSSSARMEARAGPNRLRIAPKVISIATARSTSST